MRLRSTFSIAISFVAATAVLASGVAAAKPADELNQMTLACSTTDADVFVDGENIGKAPIEFPVPVKNGNHTIRVTKPGFAPYIDVFKAVPGKPVSLSVDLVPVSGVLHVTGGTPGARVHVDGKYVGDVPVTTEVEPGKHKIEVEKACFTSFNSEASPEAGQQVEIAATMPYLPAAVNPCIDKPPPPPAWYQKKWVWGVIAGGAVVVAGGAVAAAVLSTKGDPLAGADVKYDIKGLRF